MVMVCVYLVSKKLAKCFLKLYHFTFSLAVYESSNHSTLSPPLDMVDLKNFRHSNRYVCSGI